MATQPTTEYHKELAIFLSASLAETLVADFAALIQQEVLEQISDNLCMVYAE